MQLGNTKAIRHNRGVAAYFHSHLRPNLSQWKEGSHDFYLWLRVSRGAVPDLFVFVVYVAPIGSKHKNESLFQNLVTNIAKVQTLGGILLLGGDFNVCTSTIPNTMTLAKFVNCYRCLSSLKLSKQTLWLHDKTLMLVLAVGAVSYYSMVGHLATNQGSSLVWQMGGVALSIILLVHLQFGKLLHTSR
jgi:hypothetical protein